MRALCNNDSRGKRATCNVRGYAEAFIYILLCCSARLRERVTQFSTPAAVYIYIIARVCFHFTFIASRGSARPAFSGPVGMSLIRRTYSSTFCRCSPPSPPYQWQTLEFLSRYIVADAGVSISPLVRVWVTMGMCIFNVEQRNRKKK